MDVTELRKKMLKHCQLASKIVADWPDWKKGYLQTSTQSTNKTPRMPIDKAQKDCD